MPEELKDRLLDAALAHVPFDGWSEATLAAAARDCGVDIDAARAVFPKDGVSMAAAFHKRGDAALEGWVRGDGAPVLDGLRYSEKVAELVWQRLQLAGGRENGKDIVRAATTLFALPSNAAEGARLIWGTADTIWTLLGDSSDDINWYSKRAILSGVYGSSVLYWLGDKSEGDVDTRAFIDRRIANVMQFEKLKSQARANPVLGRLMAGAGGLLSGVRAPSARRRDLPGQWHGEDSPEDTQVGK